MFGVLVRVVYFEVCGFGWFYLFSGFAEIDFGFGLVVFRIFLNFLFCLCFVGNLTLGLSCCYYNTGVGCFR